MKLKKIIAGVASLAFAVIGSLAFAPAAHAALTWTPVTINTVSCTQATGTTYPGDGHFYYCADPARITSDRATTWAKASGLPATALTALQNVTAVNAKGTIWIVRDWATFRKLTGMATMPTGFDTSRIVGWTIPNATKADSYAIQYYDSVNRPSGTTPGENLNPVLQGTEMHEVGHMLDLGFGRTLSNQLFVSQEQKHSGGINTGFETQLLKDIAFINSKVTEADRCTLFVADRVLRPQSEGQVGGTPSTGNIITVTVHDSRLSGGQKSVQITLTAAENTTAKVAAKIISTVNADTTLANLHIGSVTDGGSTALLYSDLSATSYTSSVAKGTAASATITYTLPAVAPGLIHVCAGNVLIQPYKSAATTWDILLALYPITFETSTDLTEGTFYKELVPEMFANLASTTTQEFTPGDASDSHITSANFFACSYYYVNRLRVTGVEPTTGFPSRCN